MWRKDLGTVLLHSLIPVSGPRFLLTYPSCIRNVRSPEKPLEFFQQGVVCWREKLAMVCNVFVKGMLELFSEYHHLQEGRGSYISIRNHFISPPAPTSSKSLLCFLKNSPKIYSREPTFMGCAMPMVYRTHLCSCGKSVGLWIQASL